jgi:UDP-N-acetyl-D-galactosamine dehydrogenase
MYNELLSRKKKLAVIGLGYVGLPIALEFAKDFDVIGFDINEARVKMMKNGQDPSNELDPEVFHNKTILFTANLDDVKEASFFVVAVPTDIDQHKVPNLTPLIKASETVGKVLSKGDIVVYESTVYPGCTEEDCLPVLEKVSGLKLGDFQLGYSPERIVPGDKVRTLTKILKIVSGSNEETLEAVAQVYEHIIEPGVYRAPSIKVAEAAKVIENTQRDLNISLMNELSIIFDKMEIDTQEVIKAAGTKWNFLKFYPGLVGGHCIGVDPYYLLHKSRQLGVDPQVIASGRRINDRMPAYVAKRLVQMLIQSGKSPQDCKILVMGMTFKEDVSDIRNSKVADLITELMDYSINVDVVDPHASPNEVAHEYKISMVNEISDNYDAVIVSVAHKEYKNKEISYFKSIMNNNPILFDLKAVFPKSADGISIWRL